MWYYSKNGMQMGPVSQQELSEKAKGGEVLTTDLIWREGMADWKPLAQVPEFQGVSVPMTPPAIGAVSVSLQKAAPYQGGYAPSSVPNYLWQSIVATVLGALTCWLIAMPLGIVAIVFAAKVDGLQRSGDMVGAMSASKSAKGWMIASFSCLALFVIIVAAAIIIAVASGEIK